MAFFWRTCCVIQVRYMVMKNECPVCLFVIATSQHKTHWVLNILVGQMVKTIFQSQPSEHVQDPMVLNDALRQLWTSSSQPIVETKPIPSGMVQTFSHWQNLWRHSELAKVNIRLFVTFQTLNLPHVFTCTFGLVRILFKFDPESSPFTTIRQRYLN